MAGKHVGHLSHSVSLLTVVHSCFSIVQVWTCVGAASHTTYRIPRLHLVQQLPLLFSMHMHNLFYLYDFVSYLSMISCQVSALLLVVLRQQGYCGAYLVLFEDQELLLQSKKACAAAAAIIRVCGWAEETRDMNSKLCVRSSRVLWA